MPRSWANEKLEFRCAMTIEQCVSAQLQDRFKPGTRLLLAISGGADSILLAQMLRAMPYRVTWAHINHQMRSNSRADAVFVSALARRWDLPCDIAQVNVPKYAKRHHLGLEEAARHLRYQALAKIAARWRCAAILTAHHADDQAETILMNFLRGAGPAGLAGMPEVRYWTTSRTVPIVRPLLGVTRREILRTLKKIKLPWRQDPSNRSVRYMRNRIRHVTLPYLDKLYPGLAGRLVQSADIYRAEEEFWRGFLPPYLRKTVRKDGRTMTVVLPRLLRYHKAFSRRILRHILPGLSFQDIEQVLTLARSPERTAWLKLSGRRRVKRKKNTLVVA